MASKSPRGLEMELNPNMRGSTGFPEWILEYLKFDTEEDLLLQFRGTGDGSWSLPDGFDVSEVQFAMGMNQIAQLAYNHTCGSAASVAVRKRIRRDAIKNPKLRWVPFLYV